MMNSIDSEIINNSVFRWCIYTFNALFSPSYGWLMSSILLSKDLLIYCLPSSGGTELRSYCSSLKGCGSGQTWQRSDGWGRQTSRKLQFWLSITNMWDMWHGDQGPERNTEPQLSVYCLEFHCSPVKTLRSPSPRVSEWHLRCQMPPESVESVSQVSFFNRKQTHVTPRVP